MTWTYAGSPADGLRWSQRAVVVLGRDLVSVLSSLDAGGIAAALGRLQKLAADRKAAAQLAAADDAKTDDAAALLAAMEAVKDVLPSDVASDILDRIESPDALDLVLDAARLCAVDGERFDPDAPSSMTLAEIARGVLSVMQAQSVFR